MWLTRAPVPKQSGRLDASDQYWDTSSPRSSIGASSGTGRRGRLRSHLPPLSSASSLESRSPPTDSRPSAWADRDRCQLEARRVTPRLRCPFRPTGCSDSAFASRCLRSRVPAGCQSRGHASALGEIFGIPIRSDIDSHWLTWVLEHNGSRHRWSARRRRGRPSCGRHSGSSLHGR